MPLELNTLIPDTVLALPVCSRHLLLTVEVLRPYLCFYTRCLSCFHVGRMKTKKINFPTSKQNDAEHSVDAIVLSFSEPGSCSATPAETERCWWKLCIMRGTCLRYILHWHNYYLIKPEVYPVRRVHFADRGINCHAEHISHFWCYERNFSARKTNHIQLGYTSCFTVPEGNKCFVFFFYCVILWTLASVNAIQVCRQKKTTELKDRKIKKIKRKLSSNAFM